MIKSNYECLADDSDLTSSLHDSMLTPVQQRNDLLSKLGNLPGMEELAQKLREKLTPDELIPGELKMQEQKIAQELDYERSRFLKMKVSIDGLKEVISKSEECALSRSSEEARVIINLIV